MDTLIYIFPIKKAGLIPAFCSINCRANSYLRLFDTAFLVSIFAISVKLITFILIFFL